MKPKKRIQNTKYNCQLDLVNILMLTGAWNKAENLARKTINTAQALDDKAKFCIATSDFGWLYRLKGDYPKSIENFKQSIRLSQKYDLEWILANALGRLGQVYWIIGDYENAIKCFERSKKIGEKLNIRYFIASAITHMGFIYKRIQDYPKALEHLKRGLELWEELNDTNWIGWGNNAIGDTYKEINELDKALEYMENGLKIFHKIGERRGFALVTHNKGEVFYRQGKLKKSRASLSTSLEIFNDIGDLRGASLSLGFLGAILLEERNYQQAIDYFDKAISIQEKLELKYELADFLNYKAQALFHLKKFDDAQHLNQKAHQLATTIDKKDRILEAEILSARIEFERGKPEPSIRRLIQILSETDTPEDMAVLNYELWKMTSDSKYQKKAEELFRKLNPNSNVYKFNKRLKEIRNQN